jgi:hypothetical protein
LYAPSDADPSGSEAQRERLGMVGVIQIARGPKGEIDVPKGRVPGAAKGAAGGAAAGAGAAAAALVQGSCVGFACGVAIVLLPIFMAVGAVVGAVHGGAVAVPDEKGRQIEAQLQLALAGVGTQQALRSEVITTAVRRGITNVKDISSESLTIVEEGIDYRQLLGSGVDTVLEVGLVEVGLIGAGGKDPDLTLRVQAAARLVDVGSSKELYRNFAFNYVSPRRHFSEWSADQARVLKQELSRGYATLGTSILEEVFLVVRTN